MPIKLMLTHQGAKPVILCDVCGAWIESADEGAYAWNEERPDSGTLCELVFVHKGTCLLGYLNERGSSVGDMPLETLFPILVANLGVDWEAATRTAQHFSG